jgi:hypothetical protein
MACESRLELRPTIPRGEYRKDAMVAVVYPFLVLSALGFAAMLVIHIASLFGIRAPFEHSLSFLGPGVFIVFLPTILVMNRLTRDFKQKDIWRAALRGCPQWMHRAVWIVFGYSWVGFFALPFLYGGGMDSEANKARMLSGTLLVFYLIPLAVLYSWTQARHFDEGRRCLNGHHVSPLAKFCDECGASAAPPELNTGK